MKTYTNQKISKICLLLVVANFTFCSVKEPQSVKKSYYESGELYSIVTTYPLPESRETAYITKLYYKDGIQKALITSDGSSIYYYPNGKVKSTRDAQDGLRVGVYQSFYFDGKIKEYGTYNKNGQEDGVFVSYYPSTTYLSKIAWVEGNLHGESIFYYPNGKILLSGLYRNGRKYGEWKDYDIEGMVVSSKSY